MLKQRVITACVLLLVFLSALLLMPFWAFQALVLLTFAIAAWEWTNLAGAKSLVVRLLYPVALLVGVWFGWQAIIVADIAQSFFVAVAVWWTIALLWVQGYPSSVIFWQSSVVRLAMGILTLVPAGIAVLLVHSLAGGKWLILALLLIVACADTGAYFTGKAIGRRKLAPKVSPGKSWEGVIGGLLLVTLIAIIYSLLQAKPWFTGLLIALPAAAVSVLGDLFESMLKRHRGIKDSGVILPGHGGVLDRIDGITAAAPIFALALITSPWSW